MALQRPVKYVVERHSDGYVAYPLGVEGAVVGDGETFEEALANAKSALAFHIETFGPEVLAEEDLILEALVVEDVVAS